MAEDIFKELNRQKHVARDFRGRNKTRIFLNRNADVYFVDKLTEELFDTYGVPIVFIEPQKFLFFISHKLKNDPVYKHKEIKTFSSDLKQYLTTKLEFHETKKIELETPEWVYEGKISTKNFDYKLSSQKILTPKQANLNHIIIDSNRIEQGVALMDHGKLFEEIRGTYNKWKRSF